jgi:hypothetical protein
MRDWPSELLGVLWGAGRRAPVNAPRAARAPGHLPPFPNPTACAVPGPCRLDKLPAPRYVVFTADPDPVTGVPWCPDCVLSVPAVRRVLEDRGAALLEVGVGQRSDWKGNAVHPCRHAGSGGSTDTRLARRAGRPRGRLQTRLWWRLRPAAACWQLAVPRASTALISSPSAPSGTACGLPLMPAAPWPPSPLPQDRPPLQGQRCAHPCSLAGRRQGRRPAGARAGERQVPRGGGCACREVRTGHSKGGGVGPGSSHCARLGARSAARPPGATPRPRPRRGKGEELP